MPYLIDSHEDIAYNALTFGRDYLRSAFETREIEKDGPNPKRTGHTLLGWPEYQRGQVAVIFSTVFLAPKRYGAGAWETQVYVDSGEARRLSEQQIDYYRRLTGEHPDQFRLILNQSDLRQVIEPWEKEPASLPFPGESSGSGEPREEEEAVKTVTHPVGLVLLMESAEGLRAPEELEDFYEMGVRMVGPVWAGTRYCGGTIEHGGFTREGHALMEVMAGLGLALDISHMTEESALVALDRYEGSIVATHANARALIKGVEGERHLTDRTIRSLVERDGVMGVLPFNRFLVPEWRDGDDRRLVTLRTLAAHIDHICQIAGSAQHAGVGTDFDGGFGWPAVPYELNTIADLQKIAPLLAEYGYSPESIGDIMGNNWRRRLERILPIS